MCDPISALLGVGTAVSTYGQIKQGQAAAKAGEREEQSYSELADRRLEKVKYDIEQVTRDYTRKTGKNIAAIGQSGIAVTSFYDVLADSANELEREKAALRYTAKLEADQLRERGSIAVSAGKDAQTASYIGAAGTVINGGVKLSGAFDSPQGSWQTTTYNASGQVI